MAMTRDCLGVLHLRALVTTESLFSQIWSQLERHLRKVVLPNEWRSNLTLVQQEAKRPLAFLGHSLGGLLIKEVQ
jgi:hypothetical protein